jgi:superfamily II DNA or RNA helicase
MADVTISKVDELWIHVDCDRGIAYELNDHFSYFAEGYKFMPKFKHGVWDVKIRMFNTASCNLYMGLVPDLIKFCDKYGYTHEIQAGVNPVNIKSMIKEFIKDESIDAISRYNPYEYQMLAVIGALMENKTLILSPTGSGKSLIIYLITRFLVDSLDQRVLIVVPTTTLVEQLTKDFKDYDPAQAFDEECHKIYSGKDKQSNKMVTVTTWQSVYKMHKEWFDEYDAVIVDEAHQADAKSITGILHKMPNAVYRTGLTGTLSGAKSHEWFMRGIFGKLIKTTTTRQLMDEGKLANLQVDMVTLKYSKDERKAVSKMKYQDEIAFLVDHELRNKLIVNLSIKQTGNTMVLFNFVEGHGEILFKMAEEKAIAAGKELYIIHGGTPVEERERIRALVEVQDNVMIYASYGVFSTGINMKNLHVVIFAHPFKSKIRNLQSIGRGLRTSNSKNHAILIDFCDDLVYNKRNNSTYTHAIERLKIYDAEQFEYRIREVELTS